MNKIATILLIISLTFVNCHQGHHHDHDHDHHEGHDHQHHHHTDERYTGYTSEGHLLILTDQTLHQAIDDFPLLLVKFYAPWCGHCKTLAPTYQELASDLAHSGQTQYAIAEIDCTIHKNACTTHGIKGYPTIRYFIDGESHQYTGRRTKQAFVEFLSSKAAEVRNSSKQEEL